MIIWLASYPRSGNTFFRILLKQLYGINTPTAYVGNDYSAFEVGKELVGHVADEWTVEEMASKSDPLIVKTHRRVPDNYPAIYLHRDGRDAIVSYARKKAKKGISYHDTLKELITTSRSSTGTWGQNVLHWLNRKRENIICVSYEALITNPERVVEQTLQQLNLDLPMRKPLQSAPTFEKLRTVNSQFFRRGVVGSHKDEMPDELHALFWQQPEHQEAMRLLGYEP
ncbi:MAG: sulfotransferase domain-containing protein [Candidatus Promineifilaceae bacterium]